MRSKKLALFVIFLVVFSFVVLGVSSDIGDVSDILQHFKNREKENPTDRKKKYFYVPLKEIKEKDWDLSISKYREIEYEEIKYEKPEVLKKKILELEQDIIKDLKNLKI